LGGGVYAIADTFVYFVTAANTTYKLTFKGFAGGALGKSTFNLYEATLSTNELSSTPQIKVVPNPINGLGEIITDSKVEKITIQNLQGKVILENSLSNSFDISNYASGIYLMTVQTDKGLTKLKLIKQ
jgi:calcineurin-like phosphoesterase